MVVMFQVPESELKKWWIAKVAPKTILTYNGISKVYYDNSLIDTGCAITLIDAEIAGEFGITVPLKDKMQIGPIEIKYCKEPIKFSSMSLVGKSKTWTVNNIDVRVANLSGTGLLPIIVGDDFVQRSGLMPEEEFPIKQKIIPEKR